MHNASGFVLQMIPCDIELIKKNFYIGHADFVFKYEYKYRNENLVFKPWLETLLLGFY